MTVAKGDTNAATNLHLNRITQRNRHRRQLKEQSISFATNVLLGAMLILAVNEPVWIQGWTYKHVDYRQTCVVDVKTETARSTVYYPFTSEDEETNRSTNNDLGVTIQRHHLFSNNRTITPTTLAGSPRIPDKK